MISDSHRQREWWIPTEKWKGDRIAASLARVLLGWWKDYADDETGWRYRVMWLEVHGALRDERGEGEGRAVTVHLAPGVRFGTTAGGSLTMLYRLGCDRGETIEDAEVLGRISRLPAPRAKHS